MLKLLKLCNKYSRNIYALVEIVLNICRNALDFMCDLEPFSEIRSHILMWLNLLRPFSCLQVSEFFDELKHYKIV